MASPTDKMALMAPCLRVAAAQISNLPDTQKPDPEGTDPVVAQAREMSLKLGRTYYNWQVQSWDNAEMWPAPPAGYDKLTLLNLAADMAAGDIQNNPDDLPLDVTALDPNVVDDTASGWRHWRNAYGWLCQSITNATYWPDAPAVGTAAPASGGSAGLSASSLAPLLLPAMQTLLSNKDQKDALIGMIQTAMTGGTVNAPPVSNPAVPPA